MVITTTQGSETSSDPTILEWLFGDLASKREEPGDLDSCVDEAVITTLNLWRQ